MIKFSKLEEDYIQSAIDNVEDNIHDGGLDWDRRPIDIVVAILEYRATYVFGNEDGFYDYFDTIEEEEAARSFHKKYDAFDEGQMVTFVEYLLSKAG